MEKNETLNPCFTLQWLQHWRKKVVKIIKVMKILIKNAYNHFHTPHFPIFFPIHNVSFWIYQSVVNPFLTHPLLLLLLSLLSLLLLLLLSSSLIILSYANPSCGYFLIDKNRYNRTDNTYANGRYVKCWEKKILIKNTQIKIE